MCLEINTNPCWLFFFFFFFFSFSVLYITCYFSGHPRSLFTANGICYIKSHGINFWIVRFLQDANSASAFWSVKSTKIKPSQKCKLIQHQLCYKIHTFPSNKRFSSSDTSLAPLPKKKKSSPPPMHPHIREFGAAEEIIWKCHNLSTNKICTLVAISYWRDLIVYKYYMVRGETEQSIFQRYWLWAYQPEAEGWGVIGPYPVPRENRCPVSPI